MDYPEKSDPGDRTELQRASLSRRNLLKQGAAAMPAVLTLPSGAALAASSVYIGTVAGPGSKHLDGKLCLDTSNAELMPNGTTYKFVNTDYADVYYIPDGNYYPTEGIDGVPIDADDFCRTGGIRYLDGNGPAAVMPERVGALVSMTAVNSVAAALKVSLKDLS